MPSALPGSPLGGKRSDAAPAPPSAASAAMPPARHPNNSVHPPPHRGASAGPPGVPSARVPQPVRRGLTGEDCSKRGGNARRPAGTAHRVKTLWKLRDTPAPVYTTEAVPLWGGFCLAGVDQIWVARSSRGDGTQTGGTSVGVVRWGRAQGVLAGPKTTEG